MEYTSISGTQITCFEIKFVDGRILYTGVKNVFTNYHATENSRLVDSGSGKKTSHSVRPVRLYGRPDKSISHNQHLYIYTHTTYSACPCLVKEKKSNTEFLWVFVTNRLGLNYIYTVDTVYSTDVTQNYLTDCEFARALPSSSYPLAISRKPIEISLLLYIYFFFFPLLVRSITNAIGPQGCYYVYLCCYNSRTSIQYKTKPADLERNSVRTMFTTLIIFHYHSRFDACQYPPIPIVTVPKL